MTFEEGLKGILKDSMPLVTPLRTLESLAGQHLFLLLEMPTLTGPVEQLLVRIVPAAGPAVF